MIDDVLFDMLDDNSFEMIYDYRLQMRGQNFRTQKYFRQKKPRYFIDENTL